MRCSGRLDVQLCHWPHPALHCSTRTISRAGGHETGPDATQNCVKVTPASRRHLVTAKHTRGGEGGSNCRQKRVLLLPLHLYPAEIRRDQHDVQPGGEHESLASQVPLSEHASHKATEMKQEPPILRVKVIPAMGNLQNKVSPMAGSVCLSP